MKLVAGLMLSAAGLIAVGIGLYMSSQSESPFCGPFMFNTLWLGVLAGMLLLGGAVLALACLKSLPPKTV